MLNVVTSRRSFATTLGMAAAAIVGAPVLGSSVACTFSSVYQSILKYAPLALSGIASVVSILTGGGVLSVPISGTISTVLALAKAGIADVQAAVMQYQNAPSSDKATKLGEVYVALTVAETNIQKFWSDLTIPDQKIASLVEGLLGVITSTLLGFQTQLPAAATAPAASHPSLVQAKSVRAGLQKTITAPPKARSVGEFRKDFNQQLLSAGQGKYNI